jgi:hypothetical protein
MDFREVTFIPARRLGQPVCFWLRSHEGVVNIEIHPGGRLTATLINKTGLACASPDRRRPAPVPA